MMHARACSWAGGLSRSSGGIEWWIQIACPATWSEEKRKSKNIMESECELVTSNHVRKRWEHNCPPYQPDDLPTDSQTRSISLLSMQDHLASRFLLRGPGGIINTATAWASSSRTSSQTLRKSSTQRGHIYCMENSHLAEKFTIRAKDVSLLELRQRLAEFAHVRGWDQYHSPRNLLLALVITFLSYVWLFSPSSLASRFWLAMRSWFDAGWWN